MKRRWAGAMWFLLAGVAGTGCGEDCARRLSLRVTYTGAQTGMLFTRDSTPGGGAGLTAGTLDANRPAGRPDATVDACWSDPAAADTPGYLLEAWLDVDGDDLQPCRADVTATAACGPDPGEPQARMEFALKAMGTTEVELSFGDP
jgi:hypothetical protein